jgi:DNA-binding NarL/FixJ family response regulator
VSVGAADAPVQERLRIVVVDDHHLFRAGVKAELAAHCEIVGEAPDPARALAVIAATHPDVVLLDVHLPDGGGVSVLEGLASVPGDHQPPAVLALSVSDAAADVVPMIRAGALGYVTKTIDTDELVAAIERVAAGDAYFSPRLAAFVLQAFSAPAQAEASEPGLESLTAREREVLHHLARGYAYKRIAARLGISARTVESHVGAVLRKLQLSSRHEVTHWAAARGLIGRSEPEPGGGGVIDDSEPEPGDGGVIGDSEPEPGSTP